jgi:hypothetical protein
MPVFPSARPFRTSLPGPSRCSCLGRRGSSWASCSAWSRRSAWRTHDASTDSAGSVIGPNERYGHRSGSTRRAIESIISRSRCAVFKKFTSFLETSSVRNTQIQRAGSPVWSSPVLNRSSAISFGQWGCNFCSICFPRRKPRRRRSGGTPASGGFRGRAGGPNRPLRAGRRPSGSLSRRPR